MATSTTTRWVTSAKKVHRCSWCSTAIKPGESYTYYRWFDSGDAGTCKMHPECYKVMKEMAAGEPSHWLEFSPGDNPRGCDCGHDPACEKCRGRSKNGTD